MYFFYNSPNAALNCLFKCYDVTITYQPHWQVWLWCVWSASEKNCTAQNPQVNFVHFITVPPFIQVHIILNASISISSFCLFVWTCGVEVAVMKHGMKISTVVAMDADWKIIIIFFHLTKKTGLQVHPTTDMQVTESREEEKTEPSDKRRSSSVCFCYGLTSAGRKTLNVTWMELKSGRWMAEMAKYIYTYTYIHAKVERRMLVWISQAQFWVAGTLLDCFVQKHLAQ